jgi:GNAT superfamily N-acetyltransferase
MEWKQTDYLVSDDRELLQLDRVHSYLSTEAYWCLEIPKEVVRKAAENSLCFGVYKITEQDLLQVGYARVVSDYATFAYLCDVYIEEKFRGIGLSKWLMKCIMSHPELQCLRRFLLATKDAHGLYEKSGFKITATSDRFMEIKDNDLYSKQLTSQPSVKS